MKNTSGTPSQNKIGKTKKKESRKLDKVYNSCLVVKGIEEEDFSFTIVLLQSSKLISFLLF
jgi:hypothetical protein